MNHGGVLRRLRGRDEGSTLVLVVGTMVVLSLVLLTTLTYVMNSQKYARNDQDQAAATSAAQSGVEDLMARLNASATYVSTVDCTNGALKGPRTDGACGWTSATPNGWLPVVPGVTDPTAPRYHYALDTTGLLSSGRIAITATGRVNGVYQTVQANLLEKGASDYVYYTDFESADPANTAVYPSWSGYSAAQKTACGGDLGSVGALHWWKNSVGLQRNGAGCIEPTFIGGDVLNGKVFTNDTIYGTANSGGVKPKFMAQVTTANWNCVGLIAGSNADWESKCLRSGSVADFNGIQPVNSPLELLQDTAVPFASDPGCHYVGATRILFNGATATMTVWNRRVNNNGTAPVAVAASGGPVPSCGSGALGDINGSTVPIPSGLVIYVGNSTAAAVACPIGGIGDTLPLANDVSMSAASKLCNQGNLYVEGKYDGQVTLATAQSIVVTGDLVRTGGVAGDDLLGLVAQNSVEIFHPVTSGGTEILPGTWPKRYGDVDTIGNPNPATGIQVAAAIQTLQHSFLVQEYDQGAAKGTLYVSGSIAQKWRGIVATSSGGVPVTGYKKNYTYDIRLTNQRPPYFPAWPDSSWTVRSQGEITTTTAMKG